MELTNEEKRRIQKEVEEKIINLFKENFKIETNYINKTKVHENKIKPKRRKMDCFDDLTNEILSYNLEKMDKENIQMLITKLSLISLLDNKKSKNEDEYSITSSLVVNLVIGEKTEEKVVSYVKEKINSLFNQINIPIVISEHKYMNKQYKKTFIIGVQNSKNKVSNISQLCIISKRVLKDLELSNQMQDKIIFTIIFNDKLLEYYAEFNLNK